MGCCYFSSIKSWFQDKLDSCLSFFVIKMIFPLRRSLQHWVGISHVGCYSIVILVEGKKCQIFNIAPSQMGVVRKNVAGKPNTYPPKERKRHSQISIDKYWFTLRQWEPKCKHKYKVKYKLKGKHKYMMTVSRCIGRCMGPRRGSRKSEEPEKEGTKIQSLGAIWKHEI